MMQSASQFAKRVIEYIIRAGDALSQFANVTLLFGTNANESISGRCYRLQTEPFWSQLKWLIDLLFSPFERDHCKAAYCADLARAYKLIDEQ